MSTGGIPPVSTNNPYLDGIVANCNQFASIPPIGLQDGGGDPIMYPGSPMDFAVNFLNPRMAQTNDVINRALASAKSAQPADKSGDGGNSSGDSSGPGVGSFVAHVGGGAAVGAGIGAFFGGPIGAGIGAVAGGIIGGIASLF